MAATSKTIREKNGSNLFLKSLARAYGGAILFSFPILMTMEMWSLGASLDGFRIVIFTVLAIPLLVGLSYYDGFENTSRIRDDVIDTFVAYAVAFSAAALLLLLFNVIGPGMPADEIVGKIALQAIPASIGAMLAQSLLAGDGSSDSQAETRQRGTTYAGQLFLMMVGAVFLSMSVAPTEEMILISFKMSGWHSLGLALFSLFVMHGFIHAVEFSGHAKALTPDAPFWSVFLRYTVVGYAMALIISYYILWTFGSIDDMAIVEQIKSVIVLSVPAAVGASASRLIL